MKLYVPEIGDHIRLTKDWTFILQAEHRNTTLGDIFGYTLQGWNTGWLSQAAIEPEPERDYVINYPKEEDMVKRGMLGNKYPSYEERQAAYKKAEDESPSYQAYLAKKADWDRRSKGLFVKELEITLPAGTILAIDRIYIRKGASDYSSITFWAKGLGESEIKNRWSNKVKKWKAQRFWAKLSDCNTIEFEQLSEEETQQYTSKKKK